MTKPTRLRTRSLKIAVTEEDASKIVIPLVNVAAYILSIHNTIEMPQAETFGKAILASKTRIASLMSTATMQKISPRELSGITVEVIPIGGYFKLSLVRNTHDAVTHEEVIQSFNVTLQCKTGLPLIMKLHQIEKHLNPDSTTDQITGRSIKVLKAMGL